MWIEIELSRDFIHLAKSFFLKMILEMHLLESLKNESQYTLEAFFIWKTWSQYRKKGSSNLFPLLQLFFHMIQLTAFEFINFKFKW